MAEEAGYRAYLDNACMGRPDPEVMAEVEQALAVMKRACRPPTDYTVELHEHFPRARQAAARVFGCAEGNIALVESTSHGLGLAAEALPLRPGDNVLVCDLEFFPTVLCWRSRQKRMELEVRPVPTRNGRVGLEDFEALMDHRTRVIAISSVQEINGYRAPVADLAELAHAKGAWLVVDGVQEAGAMVVDMAELGVDVYCTGGHKWLRNPLGLGFLYLSDEIKDQADPSFYSYFNLTDPPGGWACYLSNPSRTPFAPLSVRRDASRFEIGAFSNFLGAMVLAENLKKLAHMGLAKVEKKILSLGDRLVAGLGRMGLTPVSHLEEAARSGIITFNLPGGREQEQRLNRRLDAQKVFVSVRYASGVGGVRVSPHYFNTSEDVEALLCEVEMFLAADAASGA